MSERLDQLIARQALTSPDATALLYKDQLFNYRDLQQQVEATANGLLALGLSPNDRVATYLPKQPETVFSLFGAAAAGGVFVPVNPLLKPAQVAYILKDCNVRTLVTSAQRLGILSEALAACPDLQTVILVDEAPASQPAHYQQMQWQTFCSANGHPPHNRIDADMAAILYTSGSTGNPKGVVLSHKNMVTGAHSVASYLNNTAEDRLLAALPLSFDYGFSQLTTAFSVGASVTLMDYLLPRDVIRAIEKYQITGLAAVPPLWNQLVQLEWPASTANTLRYITNSGGAMPKATTAGLRKSLPDTQVFLMYGLTEAFRSTYLPPDQIDIRPDSMGKAIPNAEVMVVRPDGSECDPHEPGELVHRGSLVAVGYWGDTAKTAERFKPAPGRPGELPLPEIAVWSGDQVKRDEEGFLYFISRLDEMIKTSGYRVSPSEVEEVIYSLPAVKEVAALGASHPTLGQGILVVASAVDDSNKEDLEKIILAHCRKELPNFMVPHAILIESELPHNQNGKIDRKQLATEHQNFFTPAETSAQERKEQSVE